MAKYKLIKLYPGSSKIGTTLKKINATRGYYYEESFDVTYSKEEVENYPEFWEEIKEPLFITEDGVEIFDPNIVVFGVNSKLPIYTTTAIAGNPFDRVLWIWFSSLDKRTEWLSNNEKKYSKNDMLSFGFKVANECDYESEVSKCFDRYINK